MCGEGCSSVSSSRHRSLRAPDPVADWDALVPTGEVRGSFCTIREVQSPSSLHTGNGLHEVREKSVGLFLLLWKQCTQYPPPWCSSCFPSLSLKILCLSSYLQKLPLLWCRTVLPMTSFTTVQSCPAPLSPYKISKMEIIVSVSPRHCKFSVIIMTSCLRFWIENMNSVTVMYSLLHCYYSIISEYSAKNNSNVLMLCF